ncbi:hypothetical protein [Actinoplanes sp. NPDC049265]|uniref:hypothetical protein n=1 Tax=Actinoplanes sp. NPDC049265 TaxID=3363902 RepID=UPI003722A52C
MMHLGSDLDRCTLRTSLTGEKCGTAPAAAGQVAETTVLPLRAGIRAEGAAILEVRWRLLLNLVE